MLNPISITPKALKEILYIIENKNIPPSYALRVGVKGGGCGGMAYMLGFDTEKKEDKIFQVDGLTLLIEKRHMMFLMGMEIDFYEGVDARGFTFINPDIPKRHDLAQEKKE
ncbi:MAG: HesB/IscA family protein [Nitritalea sp.]